MFRSMTGFGRAEKTVGDKTFFVEVKSLNGKQFDLQLKLPALLKPFEFEIRSRLQESLVRGTVECLVIIKQGGGSRPVVLNTDLIKSYYRQIAAVAGELGLDTQSLLSALLRLPEVVTPSTEELNTAEYEEFSQVLGEALDQLNAHRHNEGAALRKDLLNRIDLIRKQEEEILRFEPRRMARIREEIRQLLDRHVGKDQVDQVRFEQELVYYMEKIDIHEEQIRLRQHCEYFREIIESPELGKGKKLSFLIQEMGREINTTGSKAYDVDVQKCVVVMKDELEKAKEQVLNVL